LNLNPAVAMSEEKENHRFLTQTSFTRQVIAVLVTTPFYPCSSASICGFNGSFEGYSSRLAPPSEFGLKGH
jgi:hypothetical protein